MQNCDHHSKVKKTKWGKLDWVFFNIFSRKNGASDDRVQQVEPQWIRTESSPTNPTGLPLYKSSFLKLLQMEDEQQRKANNLKAKRPGKALKMISFSKFGIRKLFVKAKRTEKAENANNVGRVAEVVIRRQAKASMGRSPSTIRAMSPSQRLKMAQSLTRMASRQKPEILTMLEREKSTKEVRLGEELCKKRILMGGKCKPLMGGALRYDTDGVLKPDI